MEISYLGGILKRGPVERRPAVGAGALDEDWGWMGGDAELFLHATGSSCRLFTWDSLALLVRGYARPIDGKEALDLERVAEEIRCHYLESGELSVDWLDGNFSLVLLDGQANRVLLYRNLAGSSFTYYHAAADGLLFASNLAELVDVSHVAPQPNRDSLPAFFLYRCVPGRETLFDGFFRLLPGEQVCWDARGLRRVQRQTFATMRGQVIEDAEAVDRLDETMERVLLDHVRLRPGMANLLSGGVDSSYLQAVWARVAAGDDLPASVSIDVDHPHTWRDTDYAVSASRALGSRHTLVPADDPYATYLLDALATTAEPPNHVQGVYFGHLARVMVAQGVDSGLCGEGADNLFSLGFANQVYNARLLRQLMPFSWLRQGGAWASNLLGWSPLSATFRLANRLNDFTYLEHPVNRASAFTDWPAVQACFGNRAVADASADRRALLDQYAVPDCPLERLHAAGFLGDAVDSSAALWTTLFNRAGADLLCPFLDSRVVRLALSLAPDVRFRFRRPKHIIKQALARLAPADLAYRPKLSFGQPIFQWLAPGGSLRPLVDRIAAYEFVDADTLARTQQRPTWFLYSLLCYDLWHKLFIERSLPRPTRPTSAWREETAALAAR